MTDPLYEIVTRKMRLYEGYNCSCGLNCQFLKRIRTNNQTVIRNSFFITESFLILSCSFHRSCFLVLLQERRCLVGCVVCSGVTVQWLWEARRWEDSAESRAAPWAGCWLYYPLASHTLPYICIEACYGLVVTFFQRSHCEVGSSSKEACCVFFEHSVMSPRFIPAVACTSTLSFFFFFLNN